MRREERVRESSLGQNKDQLHDKTKRRGEDCVSS